MDEADQVFAQLPEELKEVWGEGEEAEREPIKINREEFDKRVMRDAGLPSQRDTRWMILAVFAALKEHISPGEAGDVMAQLPKDLRSCGPKRRRRSDALSPASVTFIVLSFEGRDRYAMAGGPLPP